ncbi:CopG family transcriptional regulator [Halorhodospira neutriphila]|uniref:CopG family transcriptional regulator n=1 Tax=Halorhodospira neutriphila TaxID=168379 RepID=A0ABS1E680_9GAMM|nr:CopG family transcriptional regulator [Halorhodospira neutriphila]MBK1726724.1 CopG family transcriptional regulator [Halorhodospira neutriphila]
MGRVTLYLDDEHERRLEQATHAAGLSVSRWVAQLVEEHAPRAEWPEPVRAMAGQWEDFPTAEEIRQEEGTKITP